MKAEAAAASRRVRVPLDRWLRWVDNFQTRHGAADLESRDGALTATAADGSSFEARLPLGADFIGEPSADAFLQAAHPDGLWGVLLVRKGGFAIARLDGDQVVERKVGRRHVQGRTKAGGQSQQRFARRRDNQARVAYEAAAEHAARILGAPAGLRVVTGGDKEALHAVLEDRRLAGLDVVDQLENVAEPRAAELAAAVQAALSVIVSVHNAG